MLTKLGLDNFKVFEKKQELNFGKKFTLIYGSNSSGKSSLFQAIQIIKETLNTPDSGFKYLGIQGEMNDFINKKDRSKEKKMKIFFEAEISFANTIRSFPVGMGHGFQNISRILDNYQNVIYPIKLGVEIIVKLEKDDTKLENISFKLKFDYDFLAKKKGILDSEADSVKKRIKERSNYINTKEILILELEYLEKLQRKNVKKYFPHFRGKIDNSLIKNFSIYKTKNVIEDKLFWYDWWEFTRKFITESETEEKLLEKERYAEIRRIKKKISLLKKEKEKLFTIRDDEKIKNLEIEIKKIDRSLKEEGSYRDRNFQRSFPIEIIRILKQLKTFDKFRSFMIKDLKENLNFTSSYIDFSRNVGQMFDSGYAFRTLKAEGNTILEKISNSLRFGRLYGRQARLPLTNISRVPEIFLTMLNRQVFKNIYTVHSTESEFNDSYRLRQENYKSVGRDGKNTPYILIKDRKTLASVNKVLENAMNIKLSLSKGRLQGENHFIFKAKDSFSGEMNDTIKMKLAGKGFNSIIPYLTEIMMHENCMILLEEIENSLHPRIISPLIDSLLTITNKNKYVLETHSKHIILKLQQLVKNKKINKEDVAVNYIERGRDGSKINHIPLDDNGDFTVSWPEGGFFPEESKIILG